MQVAIAGSSGFIGRALSAELRDAGHRVRPLLRPSSPPDPEGIRWDPAGGTIQADLLEGVDAVVNLAGESIGASRWTPAFKAKMRGSRVRSTALLARTIASLDAKPALFLSSSASGYYGERGDDELIESSAPGSGFLPDLCVEWESAAAVAGVRVAVTRSAIVLHPSGGLLKKMLIPFRLGLGGRLGDGRQWMPWITLQDQARAMAWLVERPDTSGPFNLCAPNPVRNAQFTRELAAVLHRPAVFPVPAAALRLVFGEEATRDAFVVSQRMVPSRLTDGGFTFRSPTMAPALASML